jgi:hypothetical protein
MPYAFSKAKSVIKKINYMTPVYNFFKESTAVCAAKKTKEAKDWIGGCGDILAEIIILILALAILAIFPNITVPAAELLAMCVLIVAAIFIFIIVGRH